MPDRAVARKLLLLQKNRQYKVKADRENSLSVCFFVCPVPSGLPHRSHCVPINMNRLIPVIFFRNPQLFAALNFWRFIKTHNLTHTGKGAESTGQGRTGIFLSGLVFSVHLLADDPADGVCGVLLHLGRSVGVRVIMYPKSLQRTISIIRDFARRQLSCSARSGFLAFPGGTTL